MTQTAAATQPRLDITPGPFNASRESLREWQVPDWYRDAKFGIWAHWGPQSAIEYGDWYARNMYIQGSKQYEYQVKVYGHPTKLGYKDVIPIWKADKFDPDHEVWCSHPLGHLLHLASRSGVLAILEDVLRRPAEL